MHTFVVGRGKACDPDAKREALEQLVEHNRDDERGNGGTTVNQRTKRAEEDEDGDALNSDPRDIDNVRPMTSEWIMIPSCSTCPVSIQHPHRLTG